MNISNKQNQVGWINNSGKFATRNVWCLYKCLRYLVIKLIWCLWF